MDKNGSGCYINLKETDYCLYYRPLANPNPLINHLQPNVNRLIHMSYPDHHAFSETDIKEQQPTVYNSTLEYAKAEQALLADNTASKEAKAEQIAKLQAQTDAKIVDVLTDEQKPLFEKIVAERAPVTIPESAPVEVPATEPSTTEPVQ
ncbi:hypothetical protein FQR65_LT16432 [Abscondita terminalis]|nr:hypothetical protein FQR65_LT16432 [Abscondita terminalis]